MHARPLVMTICTLLVLLFVYTGTSKLLNFSGFYSDLNNQPFPNMLTPVLAWLIPTSELLIAGLLLFKATRKAGLIVSFSLMLLFTCYICLLLTGAFAYMPCSCGGVISFLTWPQHLVFNLFFVLTTAIALVAYDNQTTFQRLSRPLVKFLPRLRSQKKE